ncbi:MAG: relaxase domain-containing protein [Acidimicrobiales bacterium]
MSRPRGWAVLSLGKLSLGQEAYYLSEVLDGAEDYYLNAGEAPGRWTGRGVAGLGLTGIVGAEELRAVLSGRRPDGALLRATRAPLPGIDVTLKSPPNRCRWSGAWATRRRPALGTVASSSMGDPWEAPMFDPGPWLAERGANGHQRVGLAGRAGRIRP